MDLFEMFENDGDRRQRRATSDEPRGKGIRGLFQRLVSTVSGEDDDEPRRRNDGNDGSRNGGNDGSRNDGSPKERRNRDRDSDWSD